MAYTLEKSLKLWSKTYLLRSTRQLFQVPDGNSIVRGEIDHRLCRKEAVDFTLRRILCGKDLLVDLDYLETLVVHTVH